MIDAVVGAVIMLIATTSLLSAVEVIEKAFADAGRQPLSSQEKQVLERLVRRDEITQDQLIKFWQNSLNTLPREVVSRRSE